MLSKTVPNPVFLQGIYSLGKKTCTEKLYIIGFTETELNCSLKLYE